MAREMRELDRIKEKVVIRLDGHQLLWLVLGCVAVAGGVFAAGYQLGQIDGPRSRAGDTVTILAPPPAEEKAAAQEAPPAAREEKYYTYDHALVQPTPPVKADDPTLQMVAEVREEFLGPRPQGDLDLAGPRPAEPATEPANRANTAFAGSRLPAGPGQQAAATPEPSPRDAEGEPVQESEFEQALDSGDDSAVDIARANTPVRAPRAPASDKPDAGVRGEAPASDAAATRGWTIQIKAFRSKDEAGQFMSVLKEAGYKPYLVEADVPERGRFYRVRLGKFKTSDEANARRRAFEKAEGFATIITPL